MECNPCLPRSQECYDALGRKVLRTETTWALRDGKAWGLQKDPGEKAAPAADNTGSSTTSSSAGSKTPNGKGSDKGANATTSSTTTATVTCPEGSVAEVVHGNSDKAQGQGKEQKPLKQVEETTRYLYDGLSRVVANEYGAHGESVAQYYRSYADIVARRQFGLKGLTNPATDPTMPLAGGLKYYHPDLRGSVSALTDPQGQVVEQYRYDAFGGLFTGVTAPYNTTGLTGHEFDPAAGLVDMKARWYAPQTGRFLTPDSYSGTATEPWTQNRYVYAGNNPITRWDPTGHFSCSLGDEVCLEDIGTDRSNWYFLRDKWSSRSGATVLDSWETLDGIYRKYQETTTEYWKYHVYYITWIDRSHGNGDFTEGDPVFSRSTTDKWTGFQPHTQDSLNQYTEDYRDNSAGPMPGEVVVSREDTVVQEYQMDGEGNWTDLVRPAPAAAESAASQVLGQAIDEVVNADAGTDYQSYADENASISPVSEDLPFCDSLVCYDGEYGTMDDGGSDYLTRDTSPVTIPSPVPATPKPGFWSKVWNGVKAGGAEVLGGAAEVVGGALACTGVVSCAGGAVAVVDGISRVWSGVKDFGRGYNGAQKGYGSDDFVGQAFNSLCGKEWGATCRGATVGLVALGTGYWQSQLADPFIVLLESGAGLASGAVAAGEALGEAESATQMRSGTGGYLEGSQGGQGLGRIAGKDINVTEKGLDIVKQHLEGFGEGGLEWGPNRAMVNRLESAMENGQPVTGADASYYLHEVSESTKMAGGMPYEQAHEAALAQFDVSPFSLYHPEVIEAMPEEFNQAWRAFWSAE